MTDVKISVLLPFRQTRLCKERCPGALDRCRLASTMGSSLLCDALRGAKMTDDTRHDGGKTRGGMGSTPVLCPERMGARGEDDRARPRQKVVAVPLLGQNSSKGCVCCGRKEYVMFVDDVDGVIAHYCDKTCHASHAVQSRGFWFVRCHLTSQALAIGTRYAMRGRYGLTGTPGRLYSVESCLALNERLWAICAKWWGANESFSAPGALSCLLKGAFAGRLGF